MESYSTVVDQCKAIAKKYHVFDVLWKYRPTNIHSYLDVVFVLPGLDSKCLYMSLIVDELKEGWVNRVEKKVAEAVDKIRVDNNLDMGGVAERILKGDYGNGREKEKKMKTNIDKKFGSNDDFLKATEAAVFNSVVNEIIAGKWGNGADLKKRLTDAGFDYIKLQSEVNRRMHAKSNIYSKIKNVIFNDPATIVFWEDGTKTVVQARGDDPFDPEKGLAMAMCKKFLGNQGNYYEEFKKWLPEEEVEEEQPMGKVIETIEDAYGITVRFEPNEALKKAIEELTDVKFNVPSSMELVSKEKKND